MFIAGKELMRNIKESAKISFFISMIFQAKIMVHSGMINKIAFQYHRPACRKKGNRRHRDCFVRIDLS